VRPQLVFAVALFALLRGFPAAAQDAASARSFLEGVYQRYGNNGPGADVAGPKAKQFFHTSLIVLVRKDQKAAEPDMGVLDGDPVCSCQDRDGIWDLKIAIRIESSSRAHAAVSFALFKERSSQDLRALDITLVTEDGQWRIYDILDKSDPKAPFALRAALEKDIQSIAHHPKRKPGR
jgi:hypothetical protein